MNGVISENKNECQVYITYVHIYLKKIRSAQGKLVRRCFAKLRNVKSQTPGFIDTRKMRDFKAAGLSIRMACMNGWRAHPVVVCEDRSHFLSMFSSSINKSVPNCDTMASSSSSTPSSEKLSVWNDTIHVLGKLLKSTSFEFWQRFLAASIGSLIASALWHSVRTTVTILDDEKSLWLQAWLSQHEDALKHVRHFQLGGSPLSRSHGVGGRLGAWTRRLRETRKQGDDDDIDNKDEYGGRFAAPKLDFQPAKGVSLWTWYGRWPVSVVSGSPKNNNPREPWLMKEMKYSVTVWFAPTGRTVVKDLLLKGRSLWLAKRAKRTEIWLSDWRRDMFQIASRPSRPLSSVIVEGDTKETLRQDAIHFLNAEKWYVSKGIPYRRGYLLHGPPGCGKTSLVTAMAGELRLPIVVLRLNSKELDDAVLISLLGQTPKDSVVLIEDIDCALPPHAEESFRMTSGGRLPVTLSGLLNAIDGVGAQEGRLLFMTTNRIDRLDEALIRPGRVDVQYYLGKATRPAAGELFDQFFSTSSSSPLDEQQLQQTTYDLQDLKQARSAFLEKIQGGKHSFAALQGVLMKARDKPGMVAKEMDHLLTSFDEAASGKPENPSVWDKIASIEKTCQAAVEREKQNEQEQRSSGRPVVKRLAGRPVDADHILN